MRQYTCLNLYTRFSGESKLERTRPPFWGPVKTGYSVLGPQNANICTGTVIWGLQRSNFKCWHYCQTEKLLCNALKVVDLTSFCWNPSQVQLWLQAERLWSFSAISLDQSSLRVFELSVFVTDRTKCGPNNRNVVQPQPPQTQVTRHWGVGHM